MSAAPSSKPCKHRRIAIHSSKPQAALGITFRALSYKLKKLGID